MKNDTCCRCVSLLFILDFSCFCFCFCSLFLLFFFGAFFSFSSLPQPNGVGHTIRAGERHSRAALFRAWCRVGHVAQAPSFLFAFASLAPAPNPCTVLGDVSRLLSLLRVRCLSPCAPSVCSLLINLALIGRRFRPTRKSILRTQSRWSWCPLRRTSPPMPRRLCPRMRNFNAGVWWNGGGE